MTGWSARAGITAPMVAGLAVTSGGEVAAATSAGLAYSGDGGATWRPSEPGGPGPLLDGVAAGGTGKAASVVVLAPIGLFRQRAGGAWSFSAGAAGLGRATVARDGSAVLLDADGSRAWSLAGDADVMVPIALPATPVSAIAAGASGDELWVVATGAVWWTSGGSPWELVRLDGRDAAGLVPRGGDRALVGLADGGLALVGPEGAVVLPVADAHASTLAMSDAGDVLLAGSDDGVIESHDGGRTWRRHALGHAPASVGVDPAGELAVVADAEGRTWRRSGRGGAWLQGGQIPGTLVTEVVAVDEELVALTAHGVVARSGDGGRSWGIAGDAAAWAVGPVMGEPQQGRGVVVASSAGVHGGGVSLPPPPRPAGHVAAAATAGGMEVACADGAAAWTSGGAATWTEGSPSAAPGAEITALAFGRPGSQPDPVLAAGIVDAVGRATVQVRLGEGEWRIVAEGRAGPGGVRLAAAPGPRGLFAAIGGTLFRPARMGELAYAREPIAGDAEPVLQLVAGPTADGSPALAALTPARIRVSLDGGLAWFDLPRPEGPAVTAIALRAPGNALELLAVQAGGAVQAIDAAHTFPFDAQE